MKIRKVEATHVAIPYQHGGPLSVFGIGTTRATMDSVYIRVDTEEGVTGWGEAFGFGACPVTAAAVSRVVAPLAIGREAENVGALVQDKLHERTIDTVAAARETAGPDFPIALDTNCSWTVEQSVEMAKQLRCFIFPGWKNLHIRLMIMPGLRACAEKAASRPRPARILATSMISSKCSMPAQST